MHHIRVCNPEITEPLLPWIVDGQTVGWLRPESASLVSRWSGIFKFDRKCLQFVPELTGFDRRTEALAEVAEALVDMGQINSLLNEPYPVTAGGRKSACCTIDRTASAVFGLRAFGQHLNGYVRDGEDLLMWIGKRSADRYIAPGKLDNLVAGGLPYGVDMFENLSKECYEEAAISPNMALNARSVGAVTYNRMASRGFRADVLYCYDLELPAGFVPQNTDGEVEEFMLLPVTEVMDLVRETDRFKLNCNLVVIDFLVRWGLIGPDDPEYLDIVTGLRPKFYSHTGAPVALSDN